jgi:putative flippase GtrA
MRPAFPPDLARMLRFGAVGLLNTALGYTIILAGLALGLGDILANMAGYSAGLTLGFFLNRKWTFRGAGGFRPGTLPRYALTFLVAYGANLTIVITAMSVGIVEDPFVHLAGNCLYSLVFYVGSARFVFVGSPVGPGALTRTSPGSTGVTT